MGTSLPHSLRWFLLAAIQLAVLGGCTTGLSVVGGPADAGAPDTGAADVTAIDTPDVSCGAGQTYCLDRCVSTQADETNCGACGRRCATGEVCQNAACVPSCAADERLCSSGDAGLTCARVQTDSRHCGECGRR